MEVPSDHEKMASKILVVFAGEKRVKEEQTFGCSKGFPVINAPVILLANILRYSFVRMIYETGSNDRMVFFACF